MNKRIAFIVISGLVMVTIAVLVLGIISANAANVTDNNRGTNGYILINNGTGQGHQGTWIDPNDLPAIVDLNKALDEEIDNRIEGDKTLSSNLDTEIKDRKTADDILQSGINNVKNDLSNEAIVREKADSILSTGLNNEISTRENADNYLQYQVDNEITNRIEGDSLLQTNINTVNNNSINRDNSLQNNINTEANTRATADNSLQNDINTEATARENEDKQLNNYINSVNSRVDDVSNRVSALEKTQYVVKTELKFIREKHLEVGAYAEYNVGRSTCSEVGLNITIPIGESYLDRENKKINSRLDRLEQKVGQSAVIERTLDNKGKLKSISISQGQLSVNGKF